MTGTANVDLTFRRPGEQYTISQHFHIRMQVRLGWIKLVTMQQYKYSTTNESYPSRSEIQKQKHVLKKFENQKQPAVPDFETCWSPYLNPRSFPILRLSTVFVFVFRHGVGSRSITELHRFIQKKFQFASYMIWFRSMDDDDFLLLYNCSCHRCIVFYRSK